MAKFDQFPVTVDVAIFTIEDGKLKVLLIKRANKPHAGEWALPGGFLRAPETTAQAAGRVLETKAGVRQVYTEQLYTFDDPKRDPRGQVLSVTYYALVPRPKLEMRPSPDTQEPTLFAADNVPAVAFDHGHILSYARQRLQAKIEYTNVVFSLLPARFTLSQLQQTYEAILGRTLDKRNFRKKFLSLGLIKATGAKLAGERHRPAELYEFVSRRPQELQRWF